jgi:hypothetical protein
MQALATQQSQTPVPGPLPESQFIARCRDDLPPRRPATLGLKRKKPVSTKKRKHVKKCLDDIYDVLWFLLARFVLKPDTWLLVSDKPWSAATEMHLLSHFCSFAYVTCHLQLKCCL